MSIDLNRFEKSFSPEYGISEDDCLKLRIFRRRNGTSAEICGAITGSPDDRIRNIGKGLMIRKTKRENKADYS